jgi:hypothetical protein
MIKIQKILYLFIEKREQDTWSIYLHPTSRTLTFDHAKYDLLSQIDTLPQHKFSCYDRSIPNIVLSKLETLLFALRMKKTTTPAHVYPPDTHVKIIALLPVQQLPPYKNIK